MKILRYGFDFDLKLYNLGDIHRGDHCHNNPIFRKVVAEIAEDKDARWVSTGDMLNVALKNSLSDTYKSKSLDSEFELLKGELGPISNKCLGMVASNHHRRFDKAVGLSLDRVIANELKIPFIGKIGIMAITCGRATYMVALHHGYGGGRKRGSKTNKLDEFSSVIPSADIYMVGHGHSFDFFINEMPYIDRKRDNLVYVRSYFSETGHFLDWDDSYAQDYQMRPMPKGAAKLTIQACNAGNHENKRVTCELVG